MAKRHRKHPRNSSSARLSRVSAVGSRAVRACPVARGLPVEHAGLESCGAPLPPHFDHESHLDVRVFSYHQLAVPLPPVRHSFLEILVCLDGTGRLAIGERVVDFAAGDVLAVDANQTHALTGFWGWRRRMLHVRFRPELVYNLGSPMCDYVFLAPFYFQSPVVSPVLPSQHPRSKAALSALRQLVLCAAADVTDPRAKAGSKAFLLEVIYLLSVHLQSGGAADTALVQQKHRASRLSRVIDYLDANFSERIMVDDAASLVNMSRTPFMKLFRHATGSTFVSYLNQVRLKHGRRLLLETDLPIAQVAAAVGFSDQSYFDRRYRRHFGEAPRDCRHPADAAPGNTDRGPDNAKAVGSGAPSGGPASAAGSRRSPHRAS